MITRPITDAMYVVFDAHDMMTLSPLTFPLASTFSAPKNFCRAVTSGLSAWAAAVSEIAHRTLGRMVEMIRLRCMI